VVSPVVTLIVALVAIIIAWKVLKGVAKTAVLILILVAAAWFVFSGGFS
jgi:hypothetical protein